MNVEKIPIEPTRRRGDGSWAHDMQQVMSPEIFVPVEQFMLWLPAGQHAGNHKHARQEALLGLGRDIFCLWEDPSGRVHKEEMNPDGSLYVFVIPSYIPHAVINKSPDREAIIFEYFDDTFRGVEPVDLVSRLERS